MLAGLLDAHHTMEAVVKRTLTPAILALGLILSGCSDPLADKIATYDPSEVQMLRDEAAAAGIESDDESLVAILEYRQQCRDIKTGLDDLAGGEASESVANSLEALIVAPFTESQPEMANYNQTLIDELRLGDPAGLLRNHTLNCANVA